MPSVFPFPTKKGISRTQLVRIGLEEFDVEQYGSEDKSDDPVKQANFYDYRRDSRGTR